MRRCNYEKFSFVIINFKFILYHLKTYCQSNHITPCIVVCHCVYTVDQPYLGANELSSRHIFSEKVIYKAYVVLLHLLVV